MEFFLVIHKRKEYMSFQDKAVAGKLLPFSWNLPKMDVKALFF